MFEVRRFYWILLHTSIRRLYVITIGIIILFLSTWLYLWYLPLNRTIQKLTLTPLTPSANINSNVNVIDAHIADLRQHLPYVAGIADKAGILHKRMYMQNNNRINCEGEGTMTQIISFFETLQNENVSFQCAQMNIAQDGKNMFVFHMQLV